MLSACQGCCWKISWNFWKKVWVKMPTAVVPASWLQTETSGNGDMAMVQLQSLRLATWGGKNSTQMGGLLVKNPKTGWTWTFIFDHNDVSFLFKKIKLTRVWPFWRPGEVMAQDIFTCIAAVVSPKYLKGLNSKCWWLVMPTAFLIVDGHQQKKISVRNYSEKEGT